MPRTPVAGRPARAAARAAALAVLGLALAACASFEAARAFERGTAALERGDAAAAVGELERPATLEPRASAVHNHLGIAYEAAGREDEALRAYQRAVELDCGNREAEHNLGALRARRAPR